VSDDPLVRSGIIDALDTKKHPRESSGTIVRTGSEGDGDDGTIVRTTAIVFRLAPDQMAVFERIAAALEGREQVFGKAKDDAIWMKAREEVLRLMGEHPVVGWEQVETSAVLTDRNGANFSRKIQWGRYVDQHLLTDRPPSADGVKIIAVDDGEKFGSKKPEFHHVYVVRLDEWHCAYNRAKELGIISDKLARKIEKSYGVNTDPKGCARCTRAAKAKEEALRAKAEALGLTVEEYDDFNRARYLSSVLGGEEIETVDQWRAYRARQTAAREAQERSDREAREERSRRR